MKLIPLKCRHFEFENRLSIWEQLIWLFIESVLKYTYTLKIKVKNNEVLKYCTSKLKRKRKEKEKEKSL